MGENFEKLNEKKNQLKRLKINLFLLNQKITKVLPLNLKNLLNIIKGR